MQNCLQTKLILLSLITLSECVSLPFQAFKNSKKPTPSNLRDDLNVFIHLIPTRELISLYQTNSNQKKVAETLAYFRSEDLTVALRTLMRLPELQEVYDFMESYGIPLPELTQTVLIKLGYEHWRSEANNATENDMTFHDFLENATGYLDVWEIESKVEEKYLRSEAYHRFIDICNKVDSEGLRKSATHSGRISRVLIMFVMMKINYKEIVKFVITLFVGYYFDENVP